MRIRVSIAELKNGERGFNYRIWVHLMAPDLSNPLSPGGKHPSRWNRAGEALTRLLLYRAWVNLSRLSVADQLPSDQYGLSETILIPSGLFALEPSHLGHLLWIRKADSQAEMYVHWVTLGMNTYGGMKTAGWGEGVEVPCRCDRGQPIPREALELEQSLQVVLYKGGRPRLCSLHPSLDVGYLWEGVMTLNEAVLFNGEQILEENSFEPSDGSTPAAGHRCPSLVRIPPQSTLGLVNMSLDPRA